MQPNTRQYLGDILLYSGLGFFLVRFADIPLRYQDRLLTPEAFVAVMLLFNGVGLGMRYIQLRLRRSYPTFLGRWYYSLSCRAHFFFCSIICCWYL